MCVSLYLMCAIHSLLSRLAKETYVKMEVGVTTVLIAYLHLILITKVAACLMFKKIKL